MGLELFLFSKYDAKEYELSLYCEINMQFIKA